MDTRRFAEVSATHLEPETYARLIHLAETQPGRLGGFRYDPDDTWHNLIVEPHTYGCWVGTGAMEDGMADGLPASLVAVLREALESGAAYVLFDADLTPMLDLPVFEHSEPVPAAMEASAATAVEAMPEIDGGTVERVVSSFLVPVHVEVEDGRVSRVTVIDKTPVRNATLADGDPDDLAPAVAASDDGQSWPAWRFGT